MRKRATHNATESHASPATDAEQRNGAFPAEFGGAGGVSAPGAADPPCRSDKPDAASGGNDDVAGRLETLESLAVVATLRGNLAERVAKRCAADANAAEAKLASLLRVLMRFRDWVWLHTTPETFARIEADVLDCLAADDASAAVDAGADTDPRPGSGNNGPGRLASGRTGSASLGDPAGSAADTAAGLSPDRRAATPTAQKARETPMSFDNGSAGKTLVWDTSSDIASSIPAVPGMYAVIGGMFGDALGGGAPTVTIAEGGVTRFLAGFGTGAAMLNAPIRIKATRPGVALDVSVTPITGRTVLTIEHGYEGAAE